MPKMKRPCIIESKWFEQPDPENKIYSFEEFDVFRNPYDLTLRKCLKDHQFELIKNICSDKPEVIYRSADFTDVVQKINCIIIEQKIKNSCNFIPQL